MPLSRFSAEFDPLDMLLSLQQDLARVFENPSGFDLGISGRGGFPLVNVFSESDSYVVRLEVPGIVPEQTTVESQGRTLLISGTRDDALPEGASYHRHERNLGRFSRAIQFPDELDLGRAEASYRNGILTIRIPKKDEAKPRQITVQAA